MRAFIASLAALLAACLSAPPDSTGPFAADAAPADAAPGAVVLETMTVPVGDCDVATSDTVLADGVAYQLVAEGMAMIGDAVEGDSEYFWNPGRPDDIRDLSGDGTIDLGLAIDDLSLDQEGSPDWGPYRDDHRYQVEFIGQGAPIVAQFHDTACGNNDGALSLTIIGPPT